MTEPHQHPGREDPAPTHAGVAMPAREAAAWVAGRLARAGHRALFAGGCVRDRLLGLEPADYDVATGATPEQIREVFPKAIGVGESFGVMLVRHGGRTIEVATFRADGPYHDGRRPAEVRFTDEREDAQRRDFTINGLFEEPESGRVLDYVGGQADLASHTLRAIGEPEARLREDRLRALRAVRFAARFALHIEPRTRAAVQAFAHDLAAVSRERVGQEVRRMLAHPTRAAAVEQCEGLGLAPVMLGEPAVPVDLRWLRALPPGASPSVALAAWMLGRPVAAAGVPVEPSTRAPAFPAITARIHSWREALLLSNDETDALQHTLHAYVRVPTEWAGADTARRKRLASGPGFGAALQLLVAEHPESASRIQADVDALATTGLAPPPFVTGNDLVRAGLKPGPQFRPLLDSLYDLQLSGAITTRTDALAEVARRVAAGPGGCSHPS